MGHYDEGFTWKKHHHLMPGRTVEEDGRGLDDVVLKKFSGQLVANSDASEI